MISSLLTKSVRQAGREPVLFRLKIRYGVEWMKKQQVRGIVIGRTMMFADAPWDVPEWLFRHEMQHVYQIARLGFVRFYLLYFYYSLRYGYANNPFEVEARKAQTESLTAEERVLWKLREGSTQSPKT